MFPVQENWAFAFYETTFQPWREARIHCWASIDLPSHPLHITSSPNCKAHSGLYASLIGPREITLSWNDKFWLEDFCVPNSLHDHPLEIMHIYTQLWNRASLLMFKTLIICEQFNYHKTASSQMMQMRLLLSYLTGGVCSQLHRDWLKLQSHS